MKAIVLAVLLGSGVAAAEPATFVANVGVGVGVEKWSDYNLVTASVTGATDDSDDKYRPTGALYADIGYRVHPDLAITGHLGFTTPRQSYVYYFCPDPMGEVNQNTRIRYMSSEIGIGITYVKRGMWINPWIGLEKLIVFSDDNNDPIDHDKSLAFGAEAGIDLFSVDHNAVALFGKVLVSRIKADQYDGDGAVYSQFAAGVAYRFW